MITSIDIRNLGVIAEAHADFGPGLTVVTGETGAGKTMVLSSLLLLLGGRADTALVRQGAARLDVDGVFEVDEDTAERAEEAGGVVEDGELIVGRTVPARGRSRARLGGRPVPASAIAGIVGSMVTIHGQSDQIRLTSQNAQREALDRFGEAAHQELVASYREAFHAAVAAKKRLDAALADRDGREEEIEDLAAATARIASLGLAVGEEEELARESARLTNVQDLRAHCEAAQGALRGGDSVPGAIDLARQALAELEGAGRYDESVVGMCQRLQSPPARAPSSRIRRPWRASTSAGPPSRTRCAGGPATSRGSSPGTRPPWSGSRSCPRPTPTPRPSSAPSPRRRSASSSWAAVSASSGGASPTPCPPRSMRSCAPCPCPTPPCPSRSPPPNPRPTVWRPSASCCAPIPPPRPAPSDRVLRAASCRA